MNLNRIKLSWKLKLYLFAIVITVIPTLVAVYNSSDIIFDELKQSNNDELRTKTRVIANHVNNFYKNSILSTLLIIKDAFENEDLNPSEKVGLLLSAVESNEEIISLSILFQYDETNIVTALETIKDSYSQMVEQKGYDPEEVFSYLPEEIFHFKSANRFLTVPVYVDEIESWVSTIVIPTEIPNAPKAFLATKVSMNQVKDFLDNSFQLENSKLMLVNEEGIQLFDTTNSVVYNHEIVEEAVEMLENVVREEGIRSYVSSEGKEYVTSVAYPENINWVVIAEVEGDVAYSPAYKIISQVFIYLGIGLILAFAGVIIYSRSISSPIKEMEIAADEITSGNFDIKINYPVNDSIGKLGNSLLTMSHKLKNSIKTIKDQNKELDEYSRTLEVKVADRTKELNKSNEELRKAYLRVVELNQEKNEFLGIAAHDLKNPLATIKGFAEILSEENVERTQQKEFSEIIINTSDRMFNIVKHLLDINALEEGDRHLEFKRFSLYDVIRRVVDSNQNYLSSKNLSLEFDKPEEDYYIFADETAAMQIIENIYSNAIKFSPTNKKIVISIEKWEVNVAVSIKDEGPGLTENDKTKIFKKFAKLSAKPTGGENSTGLGLSITKKLVELMNGKIHFESELNIGTTFIIEFPVDEQIDNEKEISKGVK